MIQRTITLLNEYQSLLEISDNLRMEFKDSLTEIQYNDLDWVEVCCQYINRQLCEIEDDMAAEALRTAETASRAEVL